jgi:hypothetical protein
MTETRPLPKLLRIETVAEALSITIPSARAAVRTNLLKGVHIGRQVRVDAGELAALIQRGGKCLPGGWRKAAPASQLDARGVR